MALDKITNTGFSTLASGIDSSQTTATLAAGTGSRFPADTFNVIIWNSTDFANPIDAADREIVRCTSRSGDVLTIVRGQEGTTGVAHNTAGKTYSVATPYSQKFRDDLDAGRMSSLDAPTLSTSAPATPVANKLYADSIVKGWVKVTGGATPAIADDLNVSSITDNGVGDFTINWATAFANANYVCVGMTEGLNTSRLFIMHDTASAQAAGSFRIQIVQEGVGDSDASDPWFLMAIGDQ